LDITPILAEQAPKVLVLSVATRFARKLLSGEKTVELRRRFPEIRARQALVKDGLVKMISRRSVFSDEFSS
jgi:hypothetical protein